MKGILALAGGMLFLFSSTISAMAQDLSAGHPRPSYAAYSDAEIDAMEAALRESLAQRSSYSFSRGWWQWDRLRCRYVDGEARFPAHRLTVSSKGWQKAIRPARLPETIWKQMLSLMIHAHPEMWQENTRPGVPADADKPRR